MTFTAPLGRHAEPGGRRLTRAMRYLAASPAAGRADGGDRVRVPAANRPPPAGSAARR
ncbi:hypothetical protein OK015_14515 [Mycobacterium sp. Aquia_216]|uniref:hypothetical protein n=1 Tax=Mycobacterium sp. Aquia_216 TaxID=2991729 RepID=UPI00227D3815|nr:hypothetical protein [Mycobacterium sp. Aquia_216]WAJ42509.1 hypothetical protein OK015_14515 [Mycobacterium sp. Aquia_216]